MIRVNNKKTLQGFQVYGIMESSKLQRQSKDQRLPGVGSREGMNRKRTKGFQSSENNGRYMSFYLGPKP